MKVIVGQKYVSWSGNMIRFVEHIDGNNVYWRDDVGPRKCTRSTFHKWAGEIHPDNSKSSELKWS